MTPLDINIKNWKEVQTENPTLRIDSQFFSVEYLEILQKIRSKKKIDRVEQVSSWVTQGPNPSFSVKGIPCLTGRNISRGRVNYSDPDYVDTAEYERLKQFQLRIGDTLITLKGKGSIGKIGYVTDSRSAIFSRDIGIIRPKNIDPGYLNAFILSKYGSKIIARGETGGTGQTTLTTTYIKDIDIPRLSIEKEVGEFVTLSEEKLSLSQRYYQEARQLLHKEIGADNLIENHDAVNTKTFEQSFGTTSRLDAEYYQKKYEQYHKLIQRYSGGCECLVDVCSVQDNNYTPNPNDYYYYIELADIGSSGEVIGYSYDYGIELPSRARRKVKANDVLISSIEGSLESCAIVPDNLDKALCSTGFYVLNSESFNSETLLVLFKSTPIQKLLKQGCSGTILTAISKPEFGKIPLPLIKQGTQTQIAKLMRKSFDLLGSSNSYLDAAKIAVEISIEHSEKEAARWIGQQRRVLQASKVS